MLEWITRYQRPLKYALIGLGIAIVAWMLIALPPTVIQSGIRFSTVFILGSLAALLASRAGVLNLAIEGKMLLGAFVGVVVLYQPDLPPDAAGINPLWGVLAAALAGGLLGLIFAVLYLRIHINLIILALALNLFVANATVFFMRTSFGVFGTLADPSITGLPTIHINFLEGIPVIGTLFSGYNIIVYLSWIAVAVISFILYYTRFGRHIRAVGENKEAAESVGINVTRVQVFALTLSGMLAGVAGSFLSLGVLSQFLENMSAGRGWIALTVAIFAMNRPVPALITSLFFGMAESLGLYVERQEAINLPSNLVQMFPQVATLGALVLVAARIRWSEILRRRTFVRDFSAQLDDLKQKVVGKPAAGD
ncbi:MAG: ABC transporter permease [Anaerolineae bacterium]|nr:ABC transporter permease [Anaerolineae bacterium]